MAVKPLNKPGMNRLNILNFALGIRAEEINDNFDLIRWWIERERLRMGGWGLVEGFELSKQMPERIIRVSEGILISREGKEVNVSAYTSPPVPINHHEIEETVTSDANGLLTLSYPVYSNHYQHVIRYAPGSYTNERDFTTEFPKEFSIKVKNTERSLSLADCEYIIGTKIQLMSEWADTEFRIKYNYADDRFDAILVKYDEDSNKYYTDYNYEDDPFPTGIISTSPSIQQIEDYYADNCYLIGFAYWHIGESIDVEFFTGDRMLRRVYVDQNNVLYLNGKPYQEKTVIYFEEPKPPTENDLWYDLEREILFIWRPGEDGIWDWQPVNDLARGITSTYQFQESDNPDDLQTFDFYAHPELFFMPGKHQLTVIIDQVVIMEDQYEELYFDKDKVDELKAQAKDILENENASEEDLVTAEENLEWARKMYQSLDGHLSGYGIKFKHPLERPSVIEIRVTHNLNTKKKDEDLFQHDHLFIANGKFVVEDPEQTMVNVKVDYEPDMGELEVFKNGLRLTQNVHYTEVLREDNGEFCNRFNLTVPLAVNDVIVYRIMRTVSSYANLKKIIKDYEDQIDDLRDYVTEQIESVIDTQDSINENHETLRRDVNNHTTAIQNLQDTVLTKTAPVTARQLEESIWKNLIIGQINIEKTTDSSQIFLPEVRETDYITVAYAVNEQADPVLLSKARLDYSIQDDPDEDGANLTLNGRWLESAAAKIYITGLKIGVR